MTPQDAWRKDYADYSAGKVKRKGGFPACPKLNVPHFGDVIKHNGEVMVLLYVSYIACSGALSLKAVNANGKKIWIDFLNSKYFHLDSYPIDVIFSTYSEQ
jgi:hypothetical protein